MASKKSSGAKKSAAKSSSKKSSKKAAKKSSSKSSSKSAKKAAKEKAPSFHPQEHTLVPKHEVLSDDEVAGFFEEYNVQPTNLPTIYKSDPALAGLEVKMGDVIRITRTSPTLGESVFFRRVSYE